MSRFVGSLTLMATLLLVLPACSPPYVNIPAQTGDVASANPDARNVRELEARSLERVIEDSNIPMPVRIDLPAGTDPLTYTAVAADLDDYDVLTPADDGEAAATLTVEQVRIRGWDAQVDVLKPAGGTARQRVTIYLRRTPFSGWTVEYTRTWRGPATVQEPAPNGDS